MNRESKQQRILIVDDEPANISILGNIFEDSYHIIVALDGASALKLACSLPLPDIILLDIMMPGMDGYEVCRVLQDDPRTKEIPVIFITALSGAETESKGLALGAVDYIRKPFTNAIVRARVQTHLNLKQQRDQLIEQQLEIKRSNRCNLMILETASEGIFGIDTKYNISFMNPAALKMLGCKESEVLGKNSCSIMHHTKPDGCKRVVEHCLACQTILTGKPQEASADLYWKKNNTSFSVDFSAAPAFANGIVTGAVIVFKDITKRQQLEQELYRVDKFEAFQVLTGGVAHDFNNLLTTIIGTLDLILWKKKIDNALRENLQLCHDAAMNAADLAAKFLTIAQSGSYSTSRIDIKKIVNQVTTSFPTDQNIDYRIDIPDDLIFLTANTVQFLQVLRNIISNAQESMPDGGQITIKVERHSGRVEKHAYLTRCSYLKLTITDQGCGISVEQKGKIFDPYYSTKGRGSKKGMGLGLTICHAIMQNHGGWIEVETKSGQGTTVFLYFPMLDEKSEQLQQGSPLR